MADGPFRKITINKSTFTEPFPTQVQFVFFFGGGGCSKVGFQCIHATCTFVLNRILLCYDLILSIIIMREMALMNQTGGLAYLIPVLLD